MTQTKVFVLAAIVALAIPLTGCATTSGGPTISTQPAHPYPAQQADTLIQQIQKDSTLSDAQKQQKITDIKNREMPISSQNH